MFSRPRGKLLAVLIAVLVVAVTAASLFLRKPQERTVIIGQADPATGYRYRFTLSSEWRRIEAETGNDLLSADYFGPPLPHPIRVWIGRHVLHQAILPNAAPSIVLMTSKVQPVHLFEIQAGYPEPIRQMWVQPLHVTQRHLQIDGFPATAVMEVYKSGRVTSLLVSLPHQPVSYRMTGRGAPYNAEETEREMQAIISSFHIEKVPSGGKR